MFRSQWPLCGPRSSVGNAPCQCPTSLGRVKALGEGGAGRAAVRETQGRRLRSSGAGSGEGAAEKRWKERGQRIRVQGRGEHGPGTAPGTGFSIQEACLPRGSAFLPVPEKAAPRPNFHFKDRRAQPSAGEGCGRGEEADGEARGNARRPKGQEDRQGARRGRRRGPDSGLEGAVRRAEPGGPGRDSVLGTR